MQTARQALLTTNLMLRRWRRWATAVGLTAAMLVLYHANGDFLPGNDATANLYLPVNLLRGRGLSFQPQETPHMFIWHLRPPPSNPPKPADPSAPKQAKGQAQAASRRTVRLAHWDWPIDPKSWQWLQKVHSISRSEPPTWRQIYQDGWLQLAGPEYYLVPSKEPDRLGYINQYGPGAGLTALPIFALLHWWTGDLEQSPAAVWYGGKFVASLCVALSVALVYLTLCRLTTDGAALVIALLYGTGTCVWSMSSQTLWQSGPNVLFLALAVYCLVQAERHWQKVRFWLWGAVQQRATGGPIGQRGGRSVVWLWAAVGGLSAGWAVVCRPTSALVAAVVAGAYLLRFIWVWRWEHGRKAAVGPKALSNSSLEQVSPLAAAGERSSSETLMAGRSGRTAAVLAALLGFLAGTAPPGLFLAAYNTYYLGAPWRFGQVEAGRRLAQAQLGQPDAWAGNLLEGLYGQLISPGRGLLVYSPILVFSIWGMALAWRQRRYWLLRPLTVAVLLLLLVQSKWFSWHGGWSFGYRLMVDAMPLAAVCAVPTVRWIRRYWPLWVLVGMLAGWSIGVQILGAFAYDVVSWNCREGLVVRLPDGRAVPVTTKEEAAQLARQTGGAVQLVLMDVDQRPWRARLWSIRDNPIWYYLTHFAQSRQRKHQLMQSI
ncbi:MAG: hypothetical protein RMI90_01620, partial [Thermoguttaceae bacterium]|nr:hypothetical protein [Thermoguttaceae bacterium]